MNNWGQFSTSLRPHYHDSFFSKYFFLYSALNSQMSRNMCSWRHNLWNAKTCIGPTFTWSNEPWFTPFWQCGGGVWWRVWYKLGYPIKFVSQAITNWGPTEYLKGENFRFSKSNIHTDSLFKLRKQFLYLYRGVGISAAVYLFIVSKYFFDHPKQ